MTDAYTPDNPLWQAWSSVFGKPERETVGGGYRYTYTPGTTMIDVLSECKAFLSTLTVDLRNQLYAHPDAYAAIVKADKAYRGVTMRVGKRRRTVRFRGDRWRVSA